jgi:penicillin amidase
VRIATKVLLAVVAVGLLLAAIVVMVLWRSDPPRSGKEQVPGLSDTATVTFDRFAIPHIAARSDADAFAALGYLHARERLWQMELFRRAAEGRLAEVLGPAAVASDRYLRTLDIPLAAERSLAILPPATQALLAAYVRGVNRWIAGRPRPLPVEFQVLRFAPEPWAPRQSFEIARMIALDLVNADFELDLARLAAKVGRERVRELMPSYPDDAPVVLPEGAAHWDTLPGDRALRRGGPGRRAVPSGPAASGGAASAAAVPSVLLAARDLPTVPALAREILDGAAMSRASNSWVIGPAKSKSGKPILANDPHLALRAPSLWYLAAIASPGFHVVGATIPGLPAVILGHNARIAWGLTNVGVDDVDFVIERLNDDSSAVETPSGWVEMDVVRDSIHVRGAPAVPFTMRRSPNGPLVERAVPGDAHTALAMRWNAREASDELTALLALDRAGDWASFSAAVRGVQVPEQNWIYADVDGNIGYRMAGRVPVRRSGDGSLPTPGWTGEGHWDRYLAFEELPWALNPPEGFIVTANNRVVGPSYPHLITRNWELPYRAARIRQMLERGGPFSQDDVRQLQMDTLDLFARWAKEPAARAAEAAGRPDLARALRAWDGTAGGDREEPSLFYVWYRTLQRMTLEDEAPGSVPSGSVLQRWMRAGTSPWFDDVRTPQREDFDTLAARAMRAAIPEAAGIRWGRIHTTLSPHALGTVKPLDAVLGLNIGPAARAGSLYTVDVASFGLRPPFVNTHAASFRQVVDLAEPDGALMVITTGESGNPVSRHYRDQVQRWWNGELVHVPVRASEGAGTSTLRLVPAP